MSEPAEWYQETEKTCSGRAKKAFRCRECGGVIPVGHRYIEIVGKWEGEFSTMRLHKLCFSIYCAMVEWLESEAGLRDYELPGFGELLDATAMEKHENDGVMPAWWPVGLPFTKKDLREAAEAGELEVAA
jgi:hypothetical protein